MTEPTWSLGTLTSVAQVLADTQDGLTGYQIGQLLKRLKMDDPGDGLTKWKRLEEAFVRRQNADGHPKRIITFIQYAMEPTNYVGRPELFTLRQDQLDEVLTFVGLRVENTGKVHRGPRSSTLDEASRNATSLRTELRRRDTHGEVLRYCTVELLKKNNFHASLEATKSVFERVRQMSGLSGDGAALIDAALSLGQSGVPMIAINGLSSKTDHDEQTGFANLIKGLAGMFRNPVAHDPRVLRAVTDTQLLELITALSMVHRRLDAAVVTAPSAGQSSGV